MPTPTRTPCSCFVPWVKTGKIEELERLRDRPPADLVPAAAAAPPPLLSVDKLESVAAAVKELASGAGGLSRRQATLENRCVCVREGGAAGRAHLHR